MYILFRTLCVTVFRTLIVAVFRKPVVFVFRTLIVFVCGRVSDPYSFDTDPDPDPGSKTHIFESLVKSSGIF
jgi:hypothetical protein